MVRRGELRGLVGIGGKLAGYGVKWWELAGNGGGRWEMAGDGGERLENGEEWWRMVGK